MSENTGHSRDLSTTDCEHYDLGPPDEVGLQVCRTCGQLVLQVIEGVPVEEFEAQRSTVVAEEGADVHLEAKEYRRIHGHFPGEKP